MTSNAINVKGLAQLQAALDSLPAKLERNIMRGALRAGANTLRDAAKANAPADTGALRDSIRTSTRVRRGVVVARVIAGGNKKGEPFYAHMVEFGTAAHIVKGPSVLGGKLFSNIEHPGARAKPFMRPALDNSAGAAVETARDYVRTRLRDKHGLDVPGPGSALDEGGEGGA